MNRPPAKKTDKSKKRPFLGENGSFTQITNRLFSQGRYLTPQAKWLYSTLKSFWNRETERIFPSYKAIEKRSGLTRPAIAKALRELEHFGWIIRERNFSRSSDYYLIYPQLIDRNSEKAEDQTYPTKPLAVEWKKYEALKRKKSRQSMKNQVWEQPSLSIIEDEEDDDDIPF